MLQYIANFQPTLREKGQLLLIDRTIDPLVPLLHPINYQVRILLQFNSSQWLKICYQLVKEAKYRYERLSD